MQSPEAACEEGERPIKKPRPNQTSLLLPQHSENKIVENINSEQFCIHTRLKELYNVEKAKHPENFKEGLKYNSYLLEKLVKQERLNTLIVNLYPGNKGYSLAFPRAPCTEMDGDFKETTFETRQWPYEETELLRYIDNEELPAYFIDLLETDFSFLFYSGCIIAQVRDYRQAYPHNKCDIHHVLFKPTLQSILADINIIMEQHSDWGREEKLNLESQIIMAANPSLCTEPNPLVSSVTSQLNHCRQLLNTHRLRRAARKFSQDTVNRKRKLDLSTYRPGLELFNAISSRAKSRRTGLEQLIKKGDKKDDKRDEKKDILDAPLIAPPSNGVNIKEFKAFMRPPETSDCLPQLIEEYILETDMPSKEKDKVRVYHIKLSILQRPSNSEYLGELYLDRDHKKNERNGVACRFSLGSRAHANRYIQQFTEIFTEGGRKSVRVKYGLSSGYKEKVAQIQAAQQAAQVNNAEQRVIQLTQNLPQSSSSPMINGTVSSRVPIVQQSQAGHESSNISLLQSQLQPSQSKPITSREVEINAIAAKLENSVQYQTQATANQQKLSMGGSGSSGNNTTFINLLNSPPANSDASAAVLNALNSVSLLPQKHLGRKIAVSGISNARLLNHTNLIAVNNSLINAAGSASSSSGINFSQTVPIKQMVRQRSSGERQSPFSALLVGTPAANRTDIVNPTSHSSLLFEKLAASSSNVGAQYAVQSPKSKPVISPLSSPTSPVTQNTINVQSLNIASLQNIPGLQNVQVQLPVFVSSSATGIQGHPASIIVSLPVPTTGVNVATSSIAAQQVTADSNMGTPTVVLSNTNAAQLVTSNIKSINQSNIRNASQTGTSIAQGSQQFQILTSVQRAKTQQQSTGSQQNVTARSIQRSPFAFKMTAPSTTQVTMSPSPNSLSNQQLQLAIQKQTQLQQIQQIYNQQQRNSPTNGAGKVRRRSNASSDPQQ